MSLLLLVIRTVLEESFPKTRAAESQVGEDILCVSVLSLRRDIVHSLPSGKSRSTYTMNLDVQKPIMINVSKRDRPPCFATRPSGDQFFVTLRLERMRQQLWARFNLTRRTPCTDALCKKNLVCGLSYCQ